MTNTTDKMLYTTAQAAEFLGISPGTLEVWRSSKRYLIPFVKVGRLVRYKKESLDAFLEARTVGAPE
jgi:excisionase family DNA binding protein